jgi:ribonuclease VapC
MGRGVRRPHSRRSSIRADDPQGAAFVIAVDSSALIAILFGEPGADRLIDHLAREHERCLSAVSYVETGTVLAGRMRGDPAQAIPLLDEFLAELGVRIHAVDEAQMRIAMRARIVFGRGFGGDRRAAAGGVAATPSAGLNFGDCFAYALAKVLPAPLLFVGDDFAATDVEPALARTPARPPSPKRP